MYFGTTTLNAIKSTPRYVEILGYRELRISKISVADNNVMGNFIAFGFASSCYLSLARFQNNSAGASLVTLSPTSTPFNRGRVKVHISQLVFKTRTSVTFLFM